MATWIRTLAVVLGLAVTACDGVLEPDISDAPDWTAEAQRFGGGGGLVQTTTSPRIFYTHFTNSSPEGGFDLYAMNPDGTEVQRLTGTLDHDRTCHELRLRQDPLADP